MNTYLDIDAVAEVVDDLEETTPNEWLLMLDVGGTPINITMESEQVAEFFGSEPEKVKKGFFVHVQGTACLNGFGGTIDDDPQFPEAIVFIEVEPEHLHLIKDERNLH